MNTYLLKENPITNIYHNKIQEHGFSQYVTERTRVTKDNVTLLDHVLHNNVYAILQVDVKETDLTGHLAIEIKLPFKQFHTGRSTLIVKEDNFSKNQLVENQFRETFI